MATLLSSDALLLKQMSKNKNRICFITKTTIRIIVVANLKKIELDFNPLSVKE